MAYQKCNYDLIIAMWMNVCRRMWICECVEICEECMYMIYHIYQMQYNICVLLQCDKRKFWITTTKMFSKMTCFKLQNICLDKYRFSNLNMRGYKIKKVFKSGSPWKILQWLSNIHYLVISNSYSDWKTSHSE